MHAYASIHINSYNKDILSSVFLSYYRFFLFALWWYSAIIMFACERVCVYAAKGCFCYRIHFESLFVRMCPSLLVVFFRYLSITAEIKRILSAKQLNLLQCCFNFSWFTIRFSLLLESLLKVH